MVALATVPTVGNKGRKQEEASDVLHGQREIGQEKGREREGGGTQGREMGRGRERQMIPTLEGRGQIVVGKNTGLKKNYLPIQKITQGKYKM